MCGIAGILHKEGEIPSASFLKGMTDALAHRGPDGEGQLVERWMGLGHRRLAIIDLSSRGAQPMVSGEGRYVLSYNGEIYNFLQLRKELEEMGCHFTSQTDTEVVLQSFSQWGEECFLRFNGMFALALWDRKEQALTLARDRYGIKPLYYCESNHQLLFGSEVKALLAHPDFSASLDPEALAQYLSFQNFFSSHTLFKGVQLLPAGSFLTLKRGDGFEPRLTSYWDYAFHESADKGSDEEYVEELERLFQQAVERQLVGEVPLGSYLSGGMDSGAITAVASHQLQELKTFTVGFDLRGAAGVEVAFDERAAAEAYSHQFRTEQYEMVLKAGDMERVLPRLTHHLEEPRVGQSYPNFYAAQLASKFVKVVLSGAGGDELFGGYPWRYYRAVVNDNFEHYIDKYYKFWQRLLPPGTLSSVLAPCWQEAQGCDPKAIFKSIFKTPPQRVHSPEEYINHSLYFEAKTFLQGLLVVEDKLSMAHGLESRVPFLDNDLVDFSMKLPVRLKLGNLHHVIRLNENEPGPKSSQYFQKTQDGKLILRQAMSRYIPLEAAQRVKQGFSAPDASWFKGESIAYVKRELLNEKARIYQFLHYPTVKKLVEQHLHGIQNRRLLIWSLLNLERWCERFLNL